jgi:hypothetical protein
MAYGTVKVDNITFDNGGSDQNVTVSGLYRATTSGVTVTGTISGAVLVGTTTVSGATVTGNVVQGTTVQGVSGTFTSLTGTTTTGTTANFVSGVFTTQVSGTTVTGTTSNFTSGNFATLSGATATFTSGIIASGTAAAPSLAILADLDTGLFSPGADQLAVATNGTGRVKIGSNGLLSVGLDGIRFCDFRPTGSLYFRGGDVGDGFMRCEDPSANAKFLVLDTGNVQNANNSYTGISDIKLKENIVDANSQWDDLKALRVRNYNLKQGQTHTQIGLVAQEVEPISPGLVYETPDRDADGNDLGTTTKAVQYSVLYMKAVKALQEAIAKIETLEGMVAVNNITIDEQQHQLSTLAARLTALESA